MKYCAWLFLPLDPGGDLQDTLQMLSETNVSFVHCLGSAGAKLFNPKPELRVPSIAPDFFSKWQEGSTFEITLYCPG